MKGKNKSRRRRESCVREKEFDVESKYTWATWQKIICMSRLDNMSYIVFMSKFLSKSDPLSFHVEICKPPP